MLDDRTPIARRAMLRNSAFVLGAGAVLAACGDRSGASDPGRLGVAPALPTLAETPIDDVAWLRTLQGISLGMLSLYAGIDELGGLSGAAAERAARFVSDHQRTAEAVGELVRTAGGAPVTEANPFYVDRAIRPALAAAADDSDDVGRDLDNIAHGFEEWCARSYQAAVTALVEPGLRSSIAVLAGEGARRSAGMALAVSPDTVVSPELSGGQAEVDADDFPFVYALPSRFGQLTGIELVIGKPNADGARQKVAIQTPSLNALRAG